MIAAKEYTRFLAAEYLDGYVSGGGAAVKFVVPADDETTAAFSSLLLAETLKAGFVSLRVDAVATRVHLMDQVFFDIARQIDWIVLARRAVRRAMADAGYAAPLPAPKSSVDDIAITVDVLAAHHKVDPVELARDLNRQLQTTLMRDFAMVQEFRVAMLRLCQAELATGQVTEAEQDGVIAWLHGELRQMSLLKSAMIFRRIGRHNARKLFFSTCHWLAINGHAGVVLELDIRRLGFARRPLPEERNGFYYTKAALLDGYELLRQLVDNTDELARCCVVIVAAPEFLTDEHRGVSAYQALKLRIHDEVRDRVRDNPFASLARLAAS
jgi:P-loop Domain of unknown function (DUF2791)